MGAGDKKEQLLQPGSSRYGLKNWLPSVSLPGVSLPDWLPMRSEAPAGATQQDAGCAMPTDVADPLHSSPPAEVPVPSIPTSATGNAPAGGKQVSASFKALLSEQAGSVVKTLTKRRCQI